MTNSQILEEASNLVNKSTSWEEYDLKKINLEEHNMGTRLSERLRLFGEWLTKKEGEKK